MNNQFVGDFKDYLKYGLLDIISEITKMKVLIVWMATHDNGNVRKGDIGYFDKLEKYKKYNENLFNELNGLVKNGKKNIESVKNIETLRKYTSCSEILEDNEIQRKEYFEGVYACAKDSDLVFFDPDKGIEIPSCKSGKRSSSKYIYWKEIEKIWEMEKDILIYQHFRRYEEHYPFALELIEKCQRRLSNVKIVPFVTRDVLFLFLTRKSNDVISNIKAMVFSKWENEFKIIIAKSEIMAVCEDSEKIYIKPDNFSKENGILINILKQNWFDRINRDSKIDWNDFQESRNAWRFLRNKEDDVRILWFDDKPEKCIRLIEFLMDKVIIDLAFSVNEAYEYLEKNKYGFIISKVNNNNETYQFFEEIRNRKITMVGSHEDTGKEIPIIVYGKNEENKNPNNTVKNLNLVKVKSSSDIIKYLHSILIKIGNRNYLLFWYNTCGYEDIDFEK